MARVPPTTSRYIGNKSSASDQIVDAAQTLLDLCNNLIAEKTPPHVRDRDGQGQAALSGALQVVLQCAGKREDEISGLSIFMAYGTAMAVFTRDFPPHVQERCMAMVRGAYDAGLVDIKKAGG